MAEGDAIVMNSFKKQLLLKTIDCDSDTVLDISGAITKELVFKKPSGSRVVESGVFVTDGSDGKLTYEFTSGELDETGTWQYRYT